MPLIKILPSEHCPAGLELNADTGDMLLEVLLKNNIKIEHACDMQCACTTCHVYVRSGDKSLKTAAEKEEDMLDRAWGLDVDSRLSCQVIIGREDLTIEIPRYTINQVAEG